jgi:hypothetical protein
LAHSARSAAPETDADRPSSPDARLTGIIGVEKHLSIAKWYASLQAYHIGSNDSLGLVHTRFCIYW